MVRNINPLNCTNLKQNEAQSIYAKSTKELFQFSFLIRMLSVSNNITISSRTEWCNL